MMIDYKKTFYIVETPTFYIENPTKKGFSFSGWTGTGISGATTDISVPVGSYGNKTFTATWGNGVYTINFDGNGHTGGDDGHGGNSGDDTEIIPNDELGYFGTAKRTNEISIRTTNGMKDKKLTLNYNY